MEIEVLEKFKSKRNNVYKAKVSYSAGRKDISVEALKDTKEYNILVMKKYSADGISVLENEYKHIKMLQESGISIPQIVCKGSDSLFLEYIQGDLVGDLVERQCIGDWIDEFALWLANFHRISNETGNLLKTDVNLRNFIYAKGIIYGLDFEDISYGDIRTDLGNICFFILTNYPSFTREKHIIMRQFLNSYEKYSGLKLTHMDRYLLSSKAEAKLRRAQRV